jgi:tRNA nucleotidyltransferase (CCA-adding enzyme)
VLRAAALLERLRSARARVREVAGLCRWAAYPPAADATDRDLRQWCAGATREAVPDLLRLWIAEARVDDARHAGRWTRAALVRLARRLRAVLTSGAPLSVGEIALSGDDLIRMGYKPGRHFRPVLERLLDLCLDDPAQNERRRLEEAVPRIMAEVAS